MPALQVTSPDGRVATLANAKKLERGNLQAQAKAALHNGQDDVIVTVGSDAYMASGQLAKGFSVASAKLDGKAAVVQGVQLAKNEPTNPWRAFKNGANGVSLQVAAGTAIAAMFGSAFFFTGLSIFTVTPVLLGAIGIGAAVGFIGASLYQGYTGTSINLPDATKVVPAAVAKLPGHDR